MEVPLVGAHAGCRYILAWRSRLSEPTPGVEEIEDTLADAVVLPSRGDPESSRRDTLVVDKPIKERSASSFGPTITVGEPFCTDSGSNPGVLTTTFPTPGESAAADRAEGIDVTMTTNSNCPDTLHAECALNY